MRLSFREPCAERLESMDLMTRPATPEDAEQVCQQRKAMYLEAGRPAHAVEAAEEPFLRWLQPKLEDGSYLGWMVEAEDRVIAGIGLIVLDWPPHPLHPTESRRGYILNVYVELEFRGKGLAKHLMLTVQAEALRMGIGYLTLHASDLGRPVYERLGWIASDEMSLPLITF